MDIIALISSSLSDKIKQWELANEYLDKAIYY